MRNPRTNSGFSTLPCLRTPEGKRNLVFYGVYGSIEGTMFEEACFCLPRLYNVGQVNSANSPLKILKKVWDVCAIDPNIYIYILKSTGTIIPGSFLPHSWFLHRSHSQPPCHGILTWQLKAMRSDRKIH